jgi:hypothetical protein
MTVEEMQIVFEGGMQLVITCYMVGFGIGMILKVIKMAMER